MNGSSSVILAVASLSLLPGLTLAQDSSTLIAAGRFEEAVESLSGADPVEADAAAREILSEVVGGFEPGDYDYAVRGLVAAKTLPNLSREIMANLDFHHGYLLYSEAIREQDPQTAASAEAALPTFREALALFQSFASTPGDPSLPVNISQYIVNAETYIEIQEAIIHRGR